MIRVKKLQDTDSHWYWIPEELVAGFNQLCEKLSGKMYMDCPDVFDSFSESFEVYSTGGCPNTPPDCFDGNSVIFI